MPKLKTLKPLVATIKPLVGRMPGEKARDQYRRETQQWRAWYNTPRWERLRRQAFERDLYRCQRSGEICAGTGNDPNSPVANHKIPHHGDQALFWDINNIETVTKRIPAGHRWKGNRETEANARWCSRSAAHKWNTASACFLFECCHHSLVVNAKVCCDPLRVGQWIKGITWLGRSQPVESAINRSE